MSSTAAEVLAELETMADPSQLESMARYGIRPARPLGGIRVPALRAMARRIGRDHGLARDLWATGVHEARLLASMVADPTRVTEGEMEAWVVGLDSWDVCDQVCSNLWSRAAFALIAAAAVHRKSEPDETFVDLLPLIEREAGDPRNFVRKAVNWALRQIGKRNAKLNEAAVATARRILDDGERSARWVASDALRELRTSKGGGR